MSNVLMNNVHLTADGVVSAGPTNLRGVVLTPAAAVVQVVLYDNASAASGPILLSLQAAANGNSVVVVDLNIRAAAGIYADVTGAGVLLDVQIG